MILAGIVQQFMLSFGGCEPPVLNLDLFENHVDDFLNVGIDERNAVKLLLQADYQVADYLILLLRIISCLS